MLQIPHVFKREKYSPLRCIACGSLAVEVLKNCSYDIVLLALGIIEISNGACNRI
jgi:hypothetical protein